MSRYINQDINYDQISEEDKLEFGSSAEYNIFEAKCHLEDYLRFFGKKDLDIIFLSFFSGKRQNDVSAILKKTQPAISYDIHRIAKQVEFVIDLLTHIDELLEFTQYTDILSTDEKDLLIVLFFTTSFTKTSKIIKQHQITCRAKFEKIMYKLKDMEEYQNVFNLFVKIENNLNKIKKTLPDK